jgi:parallel beta-helix repeat protein
MWIASLAVALTAVSQQPAAQGSAAPQVHFVPREYPTIQSAVDAASEGDLIHVAAGNYRENVVIRKSHVRVHAARGVALDGTGMLGIGFHIRGTSAQAPITGVEIAGFHVRNFERGIIVEFGSRIVVLHNEVYGNEDKALPIALGDATGIELITTHSSEVSGNAVHNNGDGGIQLRAGSTRNTIRGNRLSENGTQRKSDLNGRGILLTGAGTNDNRILENTVLQNHGRGILLSRPAGAAPITGNLIAQNRAHGNQRSGIAIMEAATDNVVVQNDARDNNLSGLAPCFRCNLVDLSVGGNVWERNRGTFNLTDDCE